MSKADRRARKRDNKAQGRVQREAELKRKKQRSGLIRGFIVVILIVVIFGVILLTGHKGSKKAATTTAKPAATTTAASTTPTTALPAFTKTACNTNTPPADPTRPTFTKAPPMTIDKTKTYIATMTTSCGTITITLDAKNAPVATNNFVFLSEQHFYDGLTFHRVIPNFVVQGGDPKGDGNGGPGYSVAGEVPKDGYPLGALAAAKTSNDPDGTMGSQFYIVTGTEGMALPDQYARFGVVTKGIDVARTIESFGTSSGTPSRKLYIFKVTISES
jgi:cyclophilin family peptidyl-prolyl cis-trans isomerase